MMSSSALSPLGSDSQVDDDMISGLARWLGEQIVKQASKVVLVQRLTDNSHQTVGDFELHGNPIDTHALAEVIYSTGLREAHTLRSSIIYIVLSVRGENDAWVGRYVFRIDAGAGAGWLQQADMPAERALIAMLMSHTDSSARLSLGHSRDILDQYERLLEQTNTHNARLLAQAQARITALEAREMEALELRDKLLSISRERELEGEELRRRHELRMSALEKVGGVAPLIFPQLARALGVPGAAAEGAPAGEAPTQARATAPEIEAFALLQTFIVSLSDKQFQTLTTVLDLSQIQMLSRLYDLIQATQEPKGGAGSPPPAACAPPAAAAPAPKPQANHSPPSTPTDPKPEPS